jgi:hypothetical protein
VYLAVEVVIMKVLTMEKDEAVKVAVPLFWFQIVYKSMTTLTCKSFNPVGCSFVHLVFFEVGGISIVPSLT